MIPGSIVAVRKRSLTEFIMLMVKGMAMRMPGINEALDMKQVRDMQISPGRMIKPIEK